MGQAKQFDGGLRRCPVWSTYSEAIFLHKYEYLPPISPVNFIGAPHATFRVLNFSSPHHVSEDPTRGRAMRDGVMLRAMSSYRVDLRRTLLSCLTSVAAMRGFPWPSHAWFSTPSPQSRTWIQGVRASTFMLAPPPGFGNDFVGDGFLPGTTNRCVDGPAKSRRLPRRRAGAKARGAGEIPGALS